MPISQVPISLTAVERTNGPDRRAGADACRMLSLRELLARLPEDAVVPIRWLREQLTNEAAAEAHAMREHAAATVPDHALLTAAEYGARRCPPRAAEWVRDACRANMLPGARKDGREWLIPSAVLGNERPAPKTGEPETRGGLPRASRPAPQRTGKQKARATAGSAKHERW